MMQCHAVTPYPLRSAAYEARDVPEDTGQILFQSGRFRSSLVPQCSVARFRPDPARGKGSHASECIYTSASLLCMASSTLAPFVASRGWRALREKYKKSGSPVTSWSAAKLA